MLEKNGDKYTDTFPISINPYQLNFSSEEAEKKWKGSYKLDEAATAEECFNYFKNKYDVNFESLEDTLKDLASYAIMNLIELEAHEDDFCIITAISEEDDEEDDGVYARDR